VNKQAIYGLPLNPRPLLEQLNGAGFCVSYATRDKLGSQLDDAIRLTGKNRVLLVDNGAFSMHKQGVSARDESYQDAYEAWAMDILDRCPNAVAVIPDVIGGSEQENAELTLTTMLPTDRCMAIWHMHESIEYLLYLCQSFGYVGVGSSGQYWKVGTPEWHARITEMFQAIDQWEATSGDIRPRLHLMRAQSQAHLYPFDTSDSTNVAVNHGRTRHEGEGHVARLATKASAKIRASSGPEAEHQLKRPLLEHLEMAAWRASLELRLAA
jgi:hypothetical protein